MHFPNMKWTDAVTAVSLMIAVLGFLVSLHYWGVGKSYDFAYVYRSGRIIIVTTLAEFLSLFYALISLALAKDKVRMSILLMNVLISAISMFILLVGHNLMAF